MAKFWMSIWAEVETNDFDRAVQLGEEIADHINDEFRFKSGLGEVLEAKLGDIEEESDEDC